MAPSPKLLSFLFLAIFSVQIHARESQFFSKVSATTATPSTTAINYNNVQDKTLPGKEEESLNKQEVDPAFIPDTQNGYGLYGQESSQFPTTTKLANAHHTTTTYQPYKTQTQTQETYTNYPADTTTTNDNYYNKNAYGEQQQNFGETSLKESEYTNMGNQNNNKYYSGANSYSNNNEYNNGANSYNNNNNEYNNGANSYKNDEKQGMSDTRYLENGKYYYDLNNENSNYYPNQYQQSSRNNYNTRGYYSSSNNGNSKYEYSNNSMQKYDSQDDFEESKEEQYVP